MSLPRDRGSSIAIRIERGRPLREAGQKRCLRGRQQACRCAEIDAARALGARHLIAVRRKVQIQREDVMLAEPMLQTQRNDRFVKLCADAARRSSSRAIGGGGAGHQQLGHLLRNRRRALHRRPDRGVTSQRPEDRDRINTDVLVEALIFSGDGGRHEILRQRISSEARPACPLLRPRFVQYLAASIDDRRRQLPAIVQ